MRLIHRGATSLIFSAVTIFWPGGSRNMRATKAPTPYDVLPEQDEATPPFVVTSWLASSVYSEVKRRKKKGS